MGPCIIHGLLLRYYKGKLETESFRKRRVLFGLWLSRLYRHGTDLCLASSEAPWQKAEPKQVHHMAREGARDSGGIPDF